MMTDKQLDKTKKYYFITEWSDSAILVTIRGYDGKFYQAVNKKGLVFYAFADNLVEEEIYNSPLYKAMKE